MSELPLKIVLEFGITPWERKRLFDKIYKGNPSFDLENEIFEKDSTELALEKSYFGFYCFELRALEIEHAKFKLETEMKEAEFEALEQLKEAEEKTRKIEHEKSKFEFERSKIEHERSKIEFERSKFEFERSKFELARLKFFEKAGAVGRTPSHQMPLDNICARLGSLLFDLVEDNGGNLLTAHKKVIITREIRNIFKEGKNCQFLLQALGLTTVNPYNVLIPRKANGQPHPPYSMNGTIQIEAARENINCNFIYAFPFEVTTHFPVFFCHPVFADFMDILHDRNINNPVLIEYQQFMENNLNRFKPKLDDCLSRLIENFLNDDNVNENQFVGNIASALEILFPPLKYIESQVEDSSISANQIKMDAAITINNFPFIILEAKNNAYSINAALQGFQYYGIIDSELIDNDPCFLITFDRGILYLYGMAKVNRRIVCTCLLSLEFTNNQFNVEGFNDTLYRFVSGLYFFYTKFSSRIQQNPPDLQHTRYSEIKSTISPRNQPLPAIFSVKSENNPSERINITFQTVMRESNDGEIQSFAYFKPCVYFVKTEDGRDAVLKLACNYNIEVHRTLSREQLAPQIIGYEKLWNRYHVILMEYLDSFSYDTVFKYLSNVLIRLNRNHIINSLPDILLKLQV